MHKTPLTVAGAKALRSELKQLKSKERSEIVQAIAEARAHGDLKENAEYHAAKERQGFIEGRIAEIEGKLANAQIIDVTKLAANADGKVVFGATVEVADVDSGEELTYRIVGEDEADIKQGMISVNSPIARGLIGKLEGDVVEINVPAGKREFEIVQVRYV